MGLTGEPEASGVPLAAERDLANWLTQQVVDEARMRLGVEWELCGFPVLLLEGVADFPPWRPDLSPPASLLLPAQLSWFLASLRPGLHDLAVRDLLMAVEGACPPL
ncbi:hypothetical protein [Vallicoccus soli]|uniref:Uncharacterized protein n=1 Tax=Vallicoccus soli TaxID=2339232 RepID=A0A3A3Z312_9ACTN|nr:hypothetical protein [Vallicoccus soli]RJK95915.1 hypothetical protein D5H78_09955 [Vallicoccus soli]